MSIEILKRIEFQNLEQFLEDVNSNFAIVQTSPLFKGIPGNEGDPGDPGNIGLRGNKFIFISLSRFQQQFPNELSSGTQIDLIYINSKLLTFENKNKLLVALNITELIDKDIIVLTNTIMLSYDFSSNLFSNTGIAFNEQSNLLNNIQQQIQNYVEYYVNHNQTINNLSNVFEGFATYAKNYADTNNTFITNSLTASSVFSPYIPGYNSNIGISITDHKYFGFADEQFPKLNKGTIVFGSIKKYYELLMNTVSTDTAQTLTSDYAPGINNIPAGIFLQDTENAGILFGYKGKQNLKRFGSIYKNNIDELVIKTDSGVNPSEFSKLLIHKDYLKYDKLVQFGNDLEVSRDTKLFTDIFNAHIKTGKFTEGAVLGNNFNHDIVEIGKQGYGSLIINQNISGKNTEILQTLVRNVADTEMYKYYVDKVLITDINGTLSKAFSLEKTVIADTPNLTSIVTTINSPNKILTSYYYGYLARKMNAVTNYVNGNYWRKNQFGTGEIPDLWLSNSLNTEGNVNLSYIFSINTTNDSVNVDGATFNISSPVTKFTNLLKKVLVTDNSGAVLNTYSIEDNILNPNELIVGNPLNIFNEFDTKVLTTKYYAHLAKKINNIDLDLAGNYWKKTQYNTFEIPNLYLSNDLIVRGNVIFKPNNNLEVFKVNKTTNKVTIGNNLSDTQFDSNNIILTQFINKVLVADNNGKLLNQYYIEPNVHNPAELPNNILISDTIAVNDSNGIAKAKHIQFLGKKINQLILWLANNYWSKPEFNTGVIPNLWLSNFLRVDTQFTAGNNANPNFSALNDETSAGKTGGNTIIKGANIKIEGKVDNVLVTDSNQNIRNDYFIEQGLPNSGPGTGGQLDVEIEADFWIKQPSTSTVTPWQPFLNVPSSVLGVLTGKHFEHLTKHIKIIRKLLFDRPTYQNMYDFMEDNLPVGSIITWDNKLGPVPPTYVVCDGRMIPGTTIHTNNYIDKFIKGSLSPGVIGGNANSLQTLLLGNMVPHYHNTNAHQHNYLKTISNGGADVLGFNSVGNREGATYTLAQTDLGGAGVTQSTPTNPATPFSIEPWSITAIVIMKFWNGIGTLPVTIMPPFSTISSIVIENNELNLTLNFALVDSTVTTLNVEGSQDNGITWNTFKILTSIVNPITNIILPNNANWSFRLKATNGDSSYTQGEYSIVSNIAVFVPWSKISSVTNTGINPNIVDVNFNKFDTSVTSMKAQASLDGIVWTDYYNGVVPITNKVTFTLPTLNDWYFRIIALNGIVTSTTPTTDEISPVIYQSINDLTPTTFVVIDAAFANYDFDTLQTTVEFDISIYESSTTLVRIEYLNASNVWVSAVSSIAVTNVINMVKSGSSWQTRQYRLKALNGLLINTYSNTILPTL